MASSIRPASLLLALVLLAIGGAERAQAIYISRNSTALTPDLLQAACIGQKGKDVCDPYSREYRFVRCSSDNATAPKPMGCPSGKVFDYVKRSCRNKSAPGVYRCPRWDCPLSAKPGPVIDPPQGQFGKPGNATFNMTEAGTFSLFCPVNGHCLGGMVIKVSVECPAPADHMPIVHSIEWEESVNNTDALPRHIDNIRGYCGDSIFLYWDEPIHIASKFHSSDPAAADVVVSPYLPQPIYKCPNWSPPATLPGEIVVVAPGVGPQNGTWTAASAGSWFAVCPVSNHCRQGMVFKVTVKPAPASYTPVVHQLQWMLTDSNYEDMTLYVGDSIYFWWPSPQTFHAASMLPHLEEY